MGDDKFEIKENKEKERKDRLSEHIRDFGRKLANEIFDVENVSISIRLRDGRRINYDTSYDYVAGEIEDKKLKKLKKKEGG